MDSRAAARLGSASLAAIAAASLAGCVGGPPEVRGTQDDPFVLTGVRELTQVAQLTGPGAVNDTERAGVAGTDLGSMINLGDRTYFLFGDTFGERDPDSYGGQGGFWRSNVSAWTTDADPADGISFAGWAPADGLGLAEALVEGDHDANDGTGEVTKIPTYGFAVEDTLYLSYMSVTHWGDAGKWDANYARLARSTDRGASWTPIDVQWPGDSNFVQIAVAPAREDGVDRLYIWGIPSGRFGGVALMRVAMTREAVEDIQAYEYFTGLDAAGRPNWSSDPARATLVVEGTIGELSVMWSDYLDRWIMTYSDAGNAYIREGLTPWGAWGDALELVPGSEYPGLYSPYLNPRYVANGGRTIYFTLSLWGPYNVFWFSADLVKAG